MGDTGGIEKTRRAQSGGELSHRLPGERRDPGTTELWMATKRTSNRHDLRSTKHAAFQETLRIVPAENQVRRGPLRDRGTNAAPGPPLSRRNRRERAE